MHATAIKPGDRFRKTDSAYRTVWVVTRVIRAPGVPTHFMLTDTEGRNDVRTISEPTLTDPNFYSPVPSSGSRDGNGRADGDDRHAERTDRPQMVRESARPSEWTAKQDRPREGRAGWLDDLGLPGVSTSGSSRSR